MELSDGEIIELTGGIFQLAINISGFQDSFKIMFSFIS